MSKVSKIRIIFKNITFDLDKFTAIAVEENNNCIEVAIYLERSRHVVYRVNNLKNADVLSIKSAELVKHFYDQAIGLGIRAVDKDTTNMFGENFVFAEKGLESILKDFTKSFRKDKKYIEAESNITEYTNKINNCEEVSLDKLDELVDELDSIIKTKLSSAKDDIKALFR